MLYGAQIWGIGPSGKLLAKSSLTPLAKLQNQCLCRTTGAYKKTPNTALKHKATVPPLDLYIDTVAMQRVVIVQGHSIEENICQILKHIQKAKAPQKGIAYKHTSQKVFCLQTTKKENKI